jgi:hypothetical protein
MPTKKTAKRTKGSTRGKKLARAKKMKEVKPLAFDSFMQFPK